MPRNPLSVLLWVRHRAVEQARLSVAGCLKAEADASDKISALDEAARRGRQAAGSGDGSFPFLDIAARSRDLARTRRSALAAHLAAAESRTIEARNRLVRERRSAEAVERLISERLAAAREQAGKAEQHALDDVARASRPRDGRARNA
jgi:flagellar export protein FliJ